MSDTDAFRNFLISYETILTSTLLTTAEKTAFLELLGDEWVNRTRHPEVDRIARRLIKDPASAVRAQTKKPKA